MYAQNNKDYTRHECKYVLYDFIMQVNILSKYCYDETIVGQNKDPIKFNLKYLLLLEIFTIPFCWRNFF